MADVVGHTGIFRVHQALHGYSDGHRLIETSFPLPARDAKTMLALSDLPGSGARLDDGGYLTGYPLADAGVYALARTWPAYEMPRPGCVWTHSLLIDYADLALLASASELMSLFRRPNQEPGAYSRFLEVKFSPAEAIDPSDRELAMDLLTALYETPSGRVIASPNVAHERLVLAIWSQQWPRLRRQFRFCTFTTADRSTDTAAFDLQLLPINERGVRSRFPDSVDALARSRIEPATAWLLHAFEDLVLPATSNLRDFLRKVGSDVTKGRESFAHLCLIHSLIARAPGTLAALSEAMALTMTHETPPAARLAIAQAAIEQRELSVEGIQFVLQNLDHLSSSDARTHGPRLVAQLWDASPSSVLAMLDGSEVSSSVAKAMLQSATAPLLVQGIERAAEIAGAVLSWRPDLVEAKEFWRLDDEATALAFRELNRDPTRRDSAIEAMFQAHRGDLAAKASRAFGNDRIAVIVARELDSTGTEEVPARLSDWLGVVTRDSWTLARVLSANALHQRTSLVAIARATQPDFVPNDVGEDPWWSCLRRAHGKATSNGETYLCSYVLGRALGYRSRSQADLFVATFETVYSAASKAEIADDVWRMLSSRLPTKWGLPDWEKCPRLRLGVIGTFLERDLPPVRFWDLTENERLFEQLVGDAADSWRGRKFLQKVQRDVSDPQRRSHWRKYRLLEDILE